MKWFKHQCEASSDERIARLEDKAGLEGYGFYFKMLEIVGLKIDSTDRCEVTFSASRWGRQANVSTKKCLFLLQCCSDVGLMLVQRADDDITVKIPNLLKYRDNHTKNLQATCKQELELEEEKELDKEIEKPKSKELSPPSASTSKKGTRLSDDWKLPKIWGEWAMSEKPNFTVEDVRRVADDFRDYWIAKPGKDGLKLDWLATWRKWVRSPLNELKPPSIGGSSRVQEARLDIARQIFGDRQNGNDRQIIDVTPGRTITGDCSNVQETVPFLRGSGIG